MRSLIALCVRHRLFVALLALLSVGWGIDSLRKVPLDVFPEFVAPQIGIQTEAPGWSPEQVERQVTSPIEAVLLGTPAVATLRSESMNGLSVINVVLQEGADPVTARQEISERIGTSLSTLPTGVSTPRLSPLTSSTMDLLKIGIQSDRLDRFALRELAEWTLKPALLAVPGVARVNVFGGDVRQWQVQIDPVRMDATGTTVTEVTQALQAAISMQGGGAIQLPEQQLPIVIADHGDISERLTSAVIRVDPTRALRIGDVAEVRPAAAIRIGDALINRKQGVLLTLSGQLGANTLATTRAIEATLAQFRPQLVAQGVVMSAALHRPANFIERALRELTRSLVVAAVLVIALLALFLRNARSAFISFVTIPLSLLAAILVIHASGGTLNTMTLGGFAVALGVVVDDAVIDIENVMRRLQSNLGSSSPRPVLEVILQASLEIRSPVFYATVVLLLAFVPVLALTGVQGRLLSPMALAFVGAVLASLLVALTVTPALCAILLRRPKAEPEPRWWTHIGQWHHRGMLWIDRHAALAGTGLAGLVLVCLTLVPFLHGEFLPMFREGHFILQVSSLQPGTSMDDMLRIGRSVSADLMALPFVASVEQQVGRAEQGEDTWGTNRSEFHVELKPDAAVDQAVAQQQIRELVARYPGMETEVMTFLGDRISETLTGDTAQVVVNVVGPDLDVIEGVSSKVLAEAKATAGVTDLQHSVAVRAPQIEVQLDAHRLEFYGARAADVMATIATAFAGTKVGQITDHEHPTDVVVSLPQASRDRIEMLEDLSVASLGGTRLPLTALADVRLLDGRDTIEHEAGRRRVGIAFNVEGRSAIDVVDDLRARLKKIELPAQTFLFFTGVAEAQSTAHRELALYSLVAVMAIALCLGLAFERPIHAALVLLNLPFALTGSVLVIASSGIGLSIGALVGLVTVFGISARNAILLLAHYEHLVLVEGVAWSRELAWRGAGERLRPVLMTALVTGMGLLPLAWGLGQPGHEIEGPLALTVLGGLISSTVLTLLFLPALARRFSFKKQASDAGEGSDTSSFSIAASDVP